MEQTDPPRRSGRLIIAIPVVMLAACCFVGALGVRYVVDPPWATLDELRSEPFLAPPPGGVEIYRDEIAPGPISFLPPQGHVGIANASGRDAGEVARWYMETYGERYQLEGVHRTVRWTG